MGHNKGKISKARRKAREEVRMLLARERAIAVREAVLAIKENEGKGNEISNNSYGVQKKH